VVDFVTLTHWPTFNVADAAITAGAVLVVIASWCARRRSPRPGLPPGRPAPTMTEAIDVVVPALLDGVRVDRAICMLTGASRTEAARLVREGKVTVGDSVVSTRSTPLAEGSRLCVEGMVAATHRCSPSPT